MMFFNRSAKRSQGKGWHQRDTHSCGLNRRCTIEPLESRQMLSVTFPAILDQALSAGAPLNLALSSTGTNAGDAISYSVAVSNSSLTNSTTSGSLLSTAIPTGNTYLKLHVTDTADGINGDMIFQLFNDLAPNTVAEITSLVNRSPSFYNNVVFHRIVQNFMIQGGDPTGTGTGGPGFKFDDEFNAALQFTSSDLLAMANSGADTNGSQFFITSAPERSLDFRYSIFGMLVEGESVRQQIAAVPVHANAQGETSAPNNAVTITSASIITDNQDGVLRLASPIGTKGTAFVTVTALDTTTNDSTSRTFQVTVGADATNDPPFLGAINPITTTANTPVNFNIPGIDLEGNPINYTATLTSTNANLPITVNSTTGATTITPMNGVAGVFGVKVTAEVTNPGQYDTPDSQVVPVYINPLAPTSIDLVSDTGANTTDNLTDLNNTTGKILQFTVSGVTSGNLVSLYSDGVLIGQATATGTSVTINTNGTVTLFNGSHAITAKQSMMNQAVNVGNTQTTVNLDSALTSALNISVDAVVPVFSASPVTTVTQGTTYSCQLSATDDSGTVVYSLGQGPSGMNYSSTGLLTWTPVNGQGPSEHVILQATDPAGNVASLAFDIAIQNVAPVLTPASTSPSLGTTDENTPITSLLTSFINNGTTTTKIETTSSLSIVGGIALIGVTGNGTWSFSTPGTNPTNVGTVSESSALLIPANATMKFIPDNNNGGPATISYRGWDSSRGTGGAKVDTTTNGGLTAFSTATDTATLAVTSVNDAPVLTGVSPKAIMLSTDSPKIITLSSYINNGTGTTKITDVDLNPTLGGIALVGVTGTGTWAYSINGTDYTDVGTIPDSSGLLLPANAKLRYTLKDTKSGIVATYTYRAWDTTSGSPGDIVAIPTHGGATAFSDNTDTFTLTVNDAPALAPATTSPVMGTTDENTATTISLTGTFINHGTGTTIITDANSNDLLGGIALIGYTGNGTWAYSTDGTTFTAVGTVSNTSALQLSATDKLRYTPDKLNGETATITYRAWDGTSGYPETYASAATNGGTTAFSAATDTASLTVTSVNDAPVLTPAAPSLGTLTTNSPTIYTLASFINHGTGSTIISDVDLNPTLGGIALLGVTGSGTWDYTTDGTTFNPVGRVQVNSALLLPANASLRYSPNNASSDTATLLYRAWDASSGTAGNKADTTTSGAATAFSSATDTASLTVTAAKGKLSGYVYIDADNDGLRITPAGQSHLALQGVTVNLLSKNTDSTWTSAGTTQTGSDGSFTFDSLPSGTYRIQEAQPAGYMDGSEAVGKIVGLARGTVSANDLIEVQLGAGETGREYNFGERGLTTGMISLRSCLASTYAVVQPTTPAATSPAPTGYTITANDSYINSSEAASTSFTFAGADVGDTYNYSVISSGGSTTINGSGTITSTTQQVTGIDVSTLLDGTLTYSVKLTDQAGNVGTAATATSKLDRVAPTGYTVTANDSLLSATESTSTGFTFAGAEVNATYNYSIASSGGGTPVTGTGTVTSATQQVTGVNVSTLPEGTLTFSVTLTDQAGNAGTPATNTATLDKTAPAGYTITAGDSIINASEAATTSFTFANAIVGAAYSYTVSSSAGGTPVTNSGTVTDANQQVPSINVSTLPDGTLTYSVKLSDAAGNVGVAATASATLDKTLPTGYSITPNDTAVNGTEAASTTFTFAGAELGDTYNYSVVSSGGGATATGTGTINSAAQPVSGVNITGLLDGTLTYSAWLTDTAGNVGTAVTSSIAILDRVAPTGFTITVGVDPINASNATSTYFTFAGAEVGATYTYTVTSSAGGNPVTLSGPVTAANQQVPGINVSGLTNGTLTYSVTLTDLAGNVSSAAIDQALLSM